LTFSPCLLQFIPNKLLHKKNAVLGGFFMSKQLFVALFALVLCSSHAVTMQSMLPDFHIVEQETEDITLLEDMKQLFFEKDKENLPAGVSFKDHKRQVVCDRAVEKHGAQVVNRKTIDGYDISMLFFERECAPINIIYVAGYFHDHTPTKEFCAPFSKIFPDFNILSFDWRGFGQSSGSNKLLRKNSFGANAYPDIQEAIKFIRSRNDKPIVVHGFCLGGAMALRAAIEAQKQNMIVPDAIGVSCIFPRFDDLYNQVGLVADYWYQKFLLKSGLGSTVLDYMMYGSLFDLNPVGMVQELKIPIFFDHAVPDKFAVINGAWEVYEKYTGKKFFLKSDIGKHVRIHTQVPHQYRQAYLAFLKKSGLLKKGTVCTNRT